MSLASPVAAQPRRRPNLIKRATNAVSRAILAHCIERVANELDAAQADLADAERKLDAQGPYREITLPHRVRELREHVAALLDEASYLDFKAASLAESDCQCACAARR